MSPSASRAAPRDGSPAAPLAILVTLAYYAPHVSGLTLHARRLAEGLAARGHRVTVLTSRHLPTLPRREHLHGVQVVRVPVAFRLGKGAVMPTYLPTLLPLLARADVVAINLPATPSEALLLPALARYLLRRPLLATYHCDLTLQSGMANRVMELAVRLANLTAAALARRLVAYTADYAQASTVLRRFPAKVEIIPPPVTIPPPDPAAVAALRRRFAPAGEVLLGLACRLAPEKGVEVLLRALPAVEAVLGPVRVLFAGEADHVLGEARFRRLVQPAIDAAGHRWVPLGVLAPPELAVFYAACHVTVLPSVNMTESFGLVQVESMLCGTPVVATDLPGVRVPVQRTGMGLIVPPADHEALAAAIVEAVRCRERFLHDRACIAETFPLAGSIAAYEALCYRLARHRPAPTTSPAP